jgi:hypothetical protein
MDRNKKITIISNSILLGWFFLDMVGVYFRNNILVTRAYKEDGIYFIIFAFTFLIFLIKDKLGKYMLFLWLFIWFVTQFYSHWYFTLFGPWEGRRRYFADTIKMIPSSNIYIPDLYHIVLHILILISFGSLIIFWLSLRKRNVRR